MRATGALFFCPDNTTPECPPAHRAGGVVRSTTGGGDKMPPSCGHPSNGGELGTFCRGLKFPSTEGCRRSRRGGQRVRNYPLTLLTCHSRARGPHKYECICGVDKAGIGRWLLLVINWGNNSALCFYYYETCDMNSIDPIPAYAGMTGG